MLTYRCRMDKTMVHILSVLTGLEDKFDNFAISRGGCSTSGRVTETSTTFPSLRSIDKTVKADAELGHDFPVELHRSYQHLTSPQKVVLWPSIYTHIINSGTQSASDLQYILHGDTQWFIRQEMKKHPLSLPTDPGLPRRQIGDSSSEDGYSKRYAFPTLTIQQVWEYTEAYFNTFNVICPILDYDSTNEVIARLSRKGYADGDPQGILALLVFALGQLALEGVFGNAISSHNSAPSGFRGGTAERPPGLEIFNEVRRRLGLVMNTCTLESVQIMLLQATYYEANSRHLDFWRCAVAASMEMQVLIRCHGIDWQSHRGDLITRAYWACNLSEGLYHLDLDLPQTGICTLEDEVPLPSFHKPQNPQGHSHGSGALLQFEYHFLATISLRKLISQINAVIHECTFSSRQLPLRQLTQSQRHPRKKRP
jgi:hypothetical protein